MEATALSIGKSVLSGALGLAKSAVAEEVALQLGVQRDKAFVTDELEMMQSFLMVAHDERGEHNKVVRTWVKQVRDVAYDVEDSLQDFVVRVDKQSWWRIPRTLLDRRHVAKQMKELRTKVEDVSQRNLRYGLIKGSSSTQPATDAAPAADAAMFGVDEARHAARQHQTRSDLAQLINEEGDNQVGVIGVWGTNGSVGHTSIIWEAYENPDVKLNFPCRAWVRVMRPFHPTEFVQSMVKQFHAAVGVGVLLEGEKKGQDLAQAFNEYVNEKRCLIVLTGLSTIEEWHQIKTCFPENKLGSRIIVSTEHVEVASLCPGRESTVSELKQLSAEQTIYAFYRQSSHDVTYPSKPASRSKLSNIPENEIQEDQSNAFVNGNMIAQKRLTRGYTMRGVLEEFQLIGRNQEKEDIIALIEKQDSTHEVQVIVVWGMGGLGKTTLIKNVFQIKDVSGLFEKKAFATVLRPFKLDELLRSLALQLDANKESMDFTGDTQKSIASMGVEDLIKVLGRRSEGKRCLIVLDDLLAMEEWDKISPSLREIENLVIVITTRREDIAKYCCQKPECIRLLNGLQEEDAINLFTRKVFRNMTTDLAEQYPALVEPAKQILKKCNGLPLAIVTIGGFLADQPTKTAAEWRRLNEHINVELEMNPKFEVIKTVVMKSYDGLPYYLKPCFLYMSIFPEDRNVSRRRLAYRWVAEGYARDKPTADRYFMELRERSMILPTQQSVCSIQGFDSCQLHDLIRDISIAESLEENLVFRLEEGCSLNTHGAMRHLAISSNWEGDECELESTMELSRIRSLTVFGKWKPFYISEKMRFLRVLDLEGTKGLRNHQLEHIGALLHLRYLSLRGCDDIFYLPDSVGNLRQLETLDIKGTGIAMLPRTTIKLSKLCYLHAGSGSGDNEKTYFSKCKDICEMQCDLCVGCCSLDPSDMGGFGRCEVFHLACCLMYPNVIRGIEDSGVKVPRGTRKLKALRTLRYVHLAWGTAIIEEIKGLTGLQKLGVVGINKKNGPGFCSAISSLSHLESLSVRSGDGLNGCLDGMSTAPENLQSLKLSGSLEKLPEWIKGLQNLVKLKLELSELSGNLEAMQVLGNLPNLSILGLWDRFLEIDVLQFQTGLFRRLTVLDLFYTAMEIELVEFQKESVPSLEMLTLSLGGTEIAFSGLELLQSIKEVRLSFHHRFYGTRKSSKNGGNEERRKRMYEELKKEEKRNKPMQDKFREELQMQLDRNENRPVLKMQ
ncbi:disease resistance protein Pik-2-like [Triticum dicoccoides]|uniref:disease resistance protein Pik-2-like n=1 Tax=Triticum dicoccoides TaxID=85692 RepID=UPI001891355E|nr:disease resistance protein Pik-2-like [Triticum dicoccoides]